MKSPGHALDSKTQRDMSARFGHDFSSVRIHADSHAADAASAMGARAFAAGSDIVFGSGEFQPGSRETDRLLAHELTHVVQQERHGPGDPGRVSDGMDASELEADRAAGDVAAGRSVTVTAAPGAAVAREENEEGGGGFSLAGFLGSDPVGAAGGFAQEAETGLSVLDNSKALGMSPLNALLTPFAIKSGVDNFGGSIREGQWGEAAKSGAGLTSALIGGTQLLGAGLSGVGLTGAGTAVSGAVGTGTLMGTAAPVIAAGLGGMYAGDKMLGGANAYAKENNIFGEGRDSTDTASDWGISVQNALHSDYLPDFIGDAAGAATAIGGSWLTAGYSGLHAAGSGLWSALTDNPYEDMMQEIEAQKSVNEMSASMGAMLSATDREEVSMSSSSVAHEEMPPLPAALGRR